MSDNNANVEIKEETEDKILTIKKETTENISRPSIKTNIKTGRPSSASCKATASCCDAGLSR
jgi:hypothetical protein